MASANDDNLKLVVPVDTIDASDNVFTVPCHLSPKVSAVDMEIRWFKGTDCVCLYKNRQLTKGKGYEDRVSMLSHELERGDVILHFSNSRQSDAGTYLCQVNNGYANAELTIKLFWESRRLKDQLRKVFVRQWSFTWTDEEKRQMEMSAQITAQQNVNLPREIRDWETDYSPQLDYNKCETNRRTANSTLRHNTSFYGAQSNDEGSKEEEAVSSSQCLKGLHTGLNDPYISVPFINMADQEALAVLPGIEEISDSRLSRKQSKSGCASPRESFTPAIPALRSPRLVLVGRSGFGKSEAGNVILGREETSQTDTSTVRQQSESRQGEVAGRQVTLVDTPDWFCPGLPLEELRQDVGHCIQLSAPGPHAFLLVLPVKSTGDERGMLEKMEECFGKRCWRNTMILFTITKESQEKSVQDLFFHSQEVRRLVMECGNRFHCLNIKETANRSQVVRLLEKTEEMVRKSKGLYTSLEYTEAENQVKEIEKLFEKERQKMKERREQKAKEKLERSLREIEKKFAELVSTCQVQISQHDEQIRKLEGKLTEEPDEKVKEELEREMEREIQQKAIVQMDLERLEEERMKKRSEIEEKHKEKMEEIWEEFEEELRVEKERNLMKVILSRNQGSMSPEKE